ncbi:hypothetical protein G7054_g4822 [Neopestalotiopsis clavispora]|nr:hypothetical protein G7054_g4822 [Neopestalotiopsis clavispora]
MGGSPSIYRMLAAWLGKHEAQLLFDLGFRDIDEPDELGHTPLIKRILHSLLLRRDYMLGHNKDPSLIFWFVQQGVDLSKTAPDLGLNYHHNCSTVAHLVSNDLGGCILYATPEDAHIVSKIASLDTTDDCKCYCTETGCTTASILLYHIIDRNSVHTKYRQDGDGTRLRFREEHHIVLMDLVSSVAEFFDYHHVDLTIYRHVYLATFRMLTFEALGIRHTCGCRSWSISSTSDDSLSGEDVEDIWEEDAHLIDRLNELQPEFDTSFDESGMGLKAFLVELWVPHMELVFQELNQVELSEAEVRDAESLGVKWDTCEEQRGMQHHRQPHSKTLQEYLRAIREIAEE